MKLVKTKHIIVLGLVVSFLMSTVVRADTTALKEAEDSTRTLKEAEDSAGTLKEAEDLVGRYFSNLTQSHIPSGILLESGSTFSREIVKDNDGGLASSYEGGGEGSTYYPGLSFDGFVNAYGDLVKSEMFSERLAKPLTLYETAASIVQDQQLYPLALAVIEYNSISNLDLERQGGNAKVFTPLRSGPVGDTRLFAGTSILSNIIFGREPTLVLPSSFFMTSTKTKVEGLTLKLGKDTYNITLDKPFKVKLPTANVTQESTFTLSFKYGSEEAMAKGKFIHNSRRFEIFDGDWEPDFELISPLCYDMPSVYASEAFKEEKAGVNLRIYPSKGTVSGEEVNSFGCRKGTGTASLERVILLVDGIDIPGNRHQGTLLKDFGDAIEAFIDLGYDVITLDYKDGRDWIQRNGLAIREVVVNTIPTWLAEEGDQRIAVLGGSMGGQTVNYALRSAELAGEAHNVGLFIAFDSPFKGANIPIAIQAFAEFMGPESSDVENLLAGLNSPAASQLLINNRFYDSDGDSGWDDVDYINLDSNRWYEPRQEYIDYQDMLKLLGGLPSESRNIAIANGSGTGKVNGDPSGGFDSRRLLYTNSDLVEGPLFDFINVVIDARVDHDGMFFSGKVTKLGWKRESTLYFNSNTLKDAERRDMAAGSLAVSVQTIVDGWNDADQTGTESMISNFSDFSFIYPGSVFGVSDDSSYVPSEDSSFLDNTEFDAIWYENCSTEHVSLTLGNHDFILAELIAFRDNQEPPVQPTLPFGACGQAYSGASVNYQAHVKKHSWLKWVQDGETAGTTGESRRMEAVRININKPDASICYSSLVEGQGWQTGVCNGKTSGTEGESLQMEAIKIWLIEWPNCEVEYRMHTQTHGWLEWVKNGEMAGTEDGKRGEAIEVRLMGECEI